MIVPVTELEVLDRCDAHPATKVQNECSEFNIPPGRTILQGQQTKVVRGNVCSRGVTLLVWVVRAISLVCCLLLLLLLLLVVLNSLILLLLILLWLLLLLRVVDALLQQSKVGQHPVIPISRHCVG